MLIHRFDRMVIIVLVSLILVLVIEVGFGISIGLPVPVLSLSSDQSIGVYGPVGFQFNIDMDKNSVESRLSITPAIDGVFSWTGRTLWFYPTSPFIIGEKYIFKLKAGSAGKFGREITKDAKYLLVAHSPDIIYLHPAGNHPELWRVEADGTNSRQLTDTGGLVYDYDVSITGRKIVYSRVNQAGGLDLWQIDGEGKEANKLLDCGKAKCITPKWSVNERQIAFSELEPGGMPESMSSNKVRIRIIDSQSARNTRLPDREFLGHSPVWSPDGTRLAYYDNLFQGIRIVNLQGDTEDIFIPSNVEQTGNWSQDGKKMIYCNLEYTVSGEPYTIIYEADLDTQQVSSIVEGQSERFEYSQPVYAPRSRKIAVGYRLTGGAINKQIKLIDLDNLDITTVTTDQRYTHAGYQWDPSGQKLVYQRLAPLSSVFTPEILVWDQESGETLIAEDAAIPRWIP